MGLVLRNITKQYGSASKPFYALRQINLEIPGGTFTIILGPSGSGKTSLINIMSTLDQCSAGMISYNGIDYARLKGRRLAAFRAAHVGYIFQKYHLLPMLTVYENIEIMAQVAKNTEEINNVLRAVGLYEWRDKYPSDLSGGQQQRVAIARALVKKSSILFCDEPTGALDYATGMEVMALIKATNETYKTTIIMVTHNETLTQFADNVIRMQDGQILTMQPGGRRT
jgi:putative ABC transport system ATP-binding protein